MVFDINISLDGIIRKLSTEEKKNKAGNYKHSNINHLNQSIEGKKGKEVNIASITCETIYPTKFV